jgi:putative redox protein
LNNSVLHSACSVFGIIVCLHWYRAKFSFIFPGIGHNFVVGIAAPGKFSIMAKVTTHIGKELYRVDIKSQGGHTLIADEPADNGGQNKGFAPAELLAAALGACTSATLRMYADRKGWDVPEVDTEVTLERDEAANKTVINCAIHVKGNLDETQRARLLHIAGNCPVHKILSNPIEIKTQMV